MLLIKTLFCGCVRCENRYVLFVNIKLYSLQPYLRSDRECPQANPGPPFVTLATRTIETAAWPTVAYLGNQDGVRVEVQGEHAAKAVELAQHDRDPPRPAQRCGRKTAVYYVENALHSATNKLKC
jgi:hypothetical protein